MTAGGSVYDDLQGFGLGARQAVVAAHEEAQDLGHDRVGTEHLLLGLLADDGLRPVLHDSGASLPAARRKVLEAVPMPEPGGRLVPRPRTPRCARALGRAPRFARAAGAELVGSDHLEIVQPARQHPEHGELAAAEQQRAAREAAQPLHRCAVALRPHERGATGRLPAPRWRC